MDERPKMKELVASFETRYKSLRSRLAELKTEDELASEGRRSGMVSEVEDDSRKCQNLDETNSGKVRKASIACHPKLCRINSDGLNNRLGPTLGRTRRNSFYLEAPSNIIPPKIPLRRLSSESAASAIRDFSGVQDMTSTFQFYKQSLNSDRTSGRRKSAPENKGEPFVLPKVIGEHQDLARRRSTSDCNWCSATSLRRQRATSAASYESSTWRVKLHKRTLSIEDDNTCDVAGSMSRSSSSSGFSSQSSLF